MVVIDASAMVQLLLRSTGWEAVESAIMHDDAFAPDLIDVEILQVVRRLWLGGEMTMARADAALEILQQLPLVRVPVHAVVAGAWRLRANASAYDACYLALAELTGGSLLTRDAGLARVPGARCPVEVLPR